MNQTTTTTSLRSRLDSLKVVRDEIRVQLHLAGLDARSEWDKIERRLENLELGSERAAVAAADATIVSVEALLLSLREFKTKLDAKTH